MMKLGVTAIVVSAVALSAGAHAQEPEPPPPRARVATALKLQVLFQRFAGEKPVASLPYTLSLSADNRPARLRLGVQVPLAVEEKDARVRYQTVGSALDCQAQALQDGRFAVECTFEQSSIYAPEGSPEAGLGEARPLSPPVLRTFRAEARLLLRDGQTGQSATATDPLSGDVLKLGVTLDVVK